MSHDPQDRKIVESRSKIGTMAWEGIKRFIGVDVNPDEGEDESGTPDLGGKE